MALLQSNFLKCASYFLIGRQLFWITFERARYGTLNYLNTLVHCFQLMVGVSIWSYKFVGIGDFGLFQFFFLYMVSWNDCLHKD